MRQSVVRPFDTRLKPQGPTLRQWVVDIQEQSSFLSGQDDYSWAVLQTGGESLFFRCLSPERRPTIEKIILQKSPKKSLKYDEGVMPRTAYSASQASRLAGVSIPTLKRMCTSETHLPIRCDFHGIVFGLEESPQCFLNCAIIFHD